MSEWPHTEFRVSDLNTRPPYDNMADDWNDNGRQILRSIRIYFGLPASRDIGIIGKLIRDLRVEGESHQHIKTSAATVSVPPLVALYMDDVQDASEYSGIEYKEIPYYYRQFSGRPRSHTLDTASDSVSILPTGMHMLLRCT